MFDPSPHPKRSSRDEARERIHDLFVRGLENARLPRNAEAMPIKLAAEICEMLMLNQEERFVSMQRALDEHMMYSSPTAILSNGNRVKDEIKRALRPEHIVTAAKNTGRTTALLENAVEHSKRSGDAVAVLGPHREALKLAMARHRLSESSHDFARIHLVSEDEIVNGRFRGYIRWVAADDWWDLKPETREKIEEDHHLLAAVGSVPPLTTIPIKAETFEDRKRELDRRARDSQVLRVDRSRMPRF